MIHLGRNLALAALLASFSLAAQDQASSLSRLSQRADLITRVRVVAVDRDDRGETRVILQSLEDLKGQSPDRITLSEPGMRACGRALWGLVPGTGLVAFLQSEDSSAKLCVSSSRSLATNEPGLLEHLRGLLESNAPNERLAVLTAGLSSPSVRVRDDSALTLPLLRDLNGLDARGDRTILAALQESLATEDRRLFSLIILASRRNLEAALPDLIEAYVSPRLAGFDRAYQRILVGFGAAALVDELQAKYRQDRRHADKILPILEALEPSQSKPLLIEMLADPQRRTALAAGTCLLFRGHSEDVLREHMTDDEISTCQQVREQRRPVFRTILRGQSADEVDRD